MRTIAVHRLDDPSLADLLEPYRNQKDAWLRARREGGTGIGEGLFLAEGELVVRALIDSGCETVSVLCAPGRLDAMGDALARLPPETPVLVAERPVLEGIIGFDLHRGILAAGRRVRAPAARELIERAGVLVVCEDLANHDNAGAVFRNVAALAGWAGRGAIPAGVLLSPRCCDPLYRKSLRVSMGHALRVPFATLEPWPAGLADVAAAGFELVALTPGAGARALGEFEPAPGRRLALLVGAEGPGLTAGAERACGARVRIPLAAGVDSLNVATALAVALARLVPPAVG